MWPPLGLLYIAGSIKKGRKDDVKIIDAFCRNLTKDEFVHEVVSGSPDLVGINCSTHTFLATMDALTDIRKALPDAKIVLGGYHSTFAAKEILTEYPFVDYVIKGEAENAFVKLLDHLDEGTEPLDVEGISYYYQGRYVDNPLALIEDLDSLTFPDRGLLGDFKYGYYFQGSL